MYQDTGNNGAQVHLSRYRHWDYWISTFAAWGMVYLTTSQVMSAWERGTGCVTFRDIGIVVLTTGLALVAVGWSVHFVLDKYPSAKAAGPGV